MKEKGVILATEQGVEIPLVTPLDPQLLEPTPVGKLPDGSRLLRVDDSTPFIGPLTFEQSQMLDPQVLAELFSQADERGRSVLESDQRERDRNSILLDAHKYLPMFEGRGETELFDPMTLSMGFAALLRVGAGERRLSSPSYYHAERIVEAFNARLASTDHEYWLTFFSPSEATQYSARLSGFAVTTESDQAQYTYVEPVIVSADGQSTGLLPEGFVMNSSAVRIRMSE